MRELQVSEIETVSGGAFVTSFNDAFEGFYLGHW